MPNEPKAMMKSTAIYTVIGAVLVTGCSTAAKDIAANYVSPLQYQSYDCDQIGAENQRLTTRVAQLGGRLDEAASNDKAIGVVGAILFWPALFALGGTKGQEAEYGRLKGEHDALQQAAIQKKCWVAPSGMAQSQQQLPPVQQPRSMPTAEGAIGTLIMQDQTTGAKTSRTVSIRNIDGEKIEYSTGDIVARDGRVLQVRIGEAILGLSSGELWTIPLRADTSGEARIQRTDVGYRPDGNIKWKVVRAGQGTLRIEADVSYGYPINSESHRGMANGKWIGNYRDGQAMPDSFTAAISGPVGPDSRGQNWNTVAGVLQLR